MGSRQENWFYRSLSESKDRGATWRVIGNQIIFSRISESGDGSLPGDNWSVRWPFFRPSEFATDKLQGIHCKSKQNASASI